MRCGRFPRNAIDSIKLKTTRPANWFFQRSLTTIKSRNFLNWNVSNSKFLSSTALTKTNEKPDAKITRITVKTYVKDGIGILKFDTVGSKVNVLTTENGNTLVENIAKLVREDKVSGIVVMSEKPGCFISGADINMLKELKTVEEAVEMSSVAHEFLNKLSTFNIPIIAAVSGHCLGGGLEFAMACSGVVALDTPQTIFGFPEVMLGILPGAGGTVRAFKNLNPTDVMSMIMTGKNLKSAQAKKVGIVKSVVKPLGPGLDDSIQKSMELLENVAIKYAKNFKKDGSLFSVDYMKSIKYALGLWVAEKEVTAKTKGVYPAPYKIIEVLKNHTKTQISSNKMYKTEADAFANLAMTPVCKNLMSIYFKRNEVRSKDYGKINEPISKIGIIGSGLMGSGIAQVSSMKGKYDITCFDISEKMLSQSYKNISKNLESMVKRKTILRFDRDRILNDLKWSTSMNDLKDVEIVIEAAAEDLTIKKKILADFENVSTNPNAIFATNTSALQLKQITAESKRPENIVGMHYFSPVPRMELLEIVKHPKISNETLAHAVDIGKKQGKTCVIVNDCPGFCTTRCLFVALTEIMMLLEEGVSPMEIDDITTQFGFVFGSVALIDQVGVDVALHIVEYMMNEFKDRFSYVNPRILSQLVQKGNLGAKSSKGIYEYSKNKKLLQSTQKILNYMNSSRKVYPVISPEFKSLDIPKTHNLSKDIIKKRIVSKFINEFILCLEENILTSPVDGDIAAILGLGFAPNTGGPFQYVDTYGAKMLVKDMQEVSSVCNRPDFIPCNMLKEISETGKKFYS